MSLFGDKQESYIGVDIGSGGIKLTELKKTKGRPQLWTYGIADDDINIHVQNSDKTPEKEKMDKDGIILPEEQGKNTPDEKIEVNDSRIKKYSKLLKRLVKEAKVSGNRASASLPVSYIFHTIVTLPEVEEDKKEEIINAEVNKLISRPVDEMQVVHQEIPSSQDTDEYDKFLVTAAPKDLVRFYTAIFQKSGLQLQELETEAFSLQRSLVGNDPATVLVVDIGRERTNFFIMDEGLPMTHRSIQVGGQNIDKVLQKILGLDHDSIGQVKKDLSKIDKEKFNSNQFDRIINPVIKEIEYGFDLYTHQVGNEDKKPEKIILTGGSSLFPPLAKRLQSKFNMKVFVGDPWARVVYQQGLKPVLDDIGPRMSVSIGLALRNIV